MKKKGKIYIFKHRVDYVKKITDDNLYNITGEKGSGKSFFGNLKDEDNSRLVIHLDSAFTPNGNKEHDFSKEIRNLLIEILGYDLNPTLYFEEKYYGVIVKYLKEKNYYHILKAKIFQKFKIFQILLVLLLLKEMGFSNAF